MKRRFGDQPEARMSKIIQLPMRERRPADGFVSAIESAGRLLAEHFPPGSADPNELPNHLIVLE